MFGRWPGQASRTGRACTPGGVKARFSRDLAQLGVRVRDRDPAFGAGGGNSSCLRGRNVRFLLAARGEEAAACERRHTISGSPGFQPRGRCQEPVCKLPELFRASQPLIAAQGRPWA
jgi:hypothetical protein